MTEKEHHHVHFGESEDSFGKDNNIVIESSRNNISIHLGFLKLFHHYEIKVDLNRAVCGIDNNVQVKVHDSAKVPNINCKIMEVVCETDSIHLKIHLLAHKEKLLKEELCLEAMGKDELYRITLVARVLGKGKGTPLLRNGIHCVGVEEMDDESETSDWQGFE